MSKNKQVFICSECGASFSKWLGKCTECGKWNSVFEQVNNPTKKEIPSAIKLSSVKNDKIVRLDTGIAEFNLVCGGGLIPGSVILIGGEPGIGKSTLSLQICEFTDSLYITGEESPLQIKHRAERLNINSDNIRIYSNCIAEDIITEAKTHKPACIIVDSIQTLRSQNLPGPAGSVTQIRESTLLLSDFAKTENIAIILIGHITKDGAIAGPKVLEHLVDTVLYFEGDFNQDFRILRAFKNRFGSVNEIGLFTMDHNGLNQVKDKNKVFINPHLSVASGNAISAAVEGSRSVLFEVQSLVNFTTFSNPRRMSDGLDLNRLILINAILEKHSQLKLSSYDVFINISGGFSVNETAADLAIALAIASSYFNKPLPERTGIIGELSLSGDIRPVTQITKRILEFKAAGFSEIILPQSNIKEAKSAEYSGKLSGVSHISEVISGLFGGAGI
jgi:DNA repair protein RadA/Sms